MILWKRDIRRSGEMFLILLSDDSASVREVLRVALESEGFAVLEAADGREGVRLYRERWPALVIVANRRPRPGERIGSLRVSEHGLRAGNRVVVEGMSELKPGMAVRRYVRSLTNHPVLSETRTMSQRSVEQAIGRLASGVQFRRHLEANRPAAFSEVVVRGLPLTPVEIRAVVKTDLAAREQFARRRDDYLHWNCREGKKP